MPNIGPLELAIVFVIVLLIFGPKRLPGLGRQLGTGMREFKESITGKGGRATTMTTTSATTARRWSPRSVAPRAKRPRSRTSPLLHVSTRRVKRRLASVAPYGEHAAIRRAR